MGAVVNSVVVLVGSLVGLFMGQRIPERINKTLMQGIALVVLDRKSTRLNSSHL